MTSITPIITLVYMLELSLKLLNVCFIVMDFEVPIWEQDKFMIPVIEDDPLLMYGEYTKIHYEFTSI
jgi:hypothetical protein